METEWGSVGDGWRAIVQPLIDRAKAEGVAIHQIKEKFGGLRFYHEVGSAELDTAVEDAEKQSVLTCESCGQPATCKAYTGWYKTLCGGCGI